MVQASGTIPATGMYAWLVGIGPYSPELARFMVYPDHELRSGTVISTILFDGCFLGNSRSRDFAAALGITDPKDPNQYAVRLERVDFVSLRGLCPSYGDLEEFLRDCDGVEQLLGHGWSLVFEPNG